MPRIRTFILWMAILLMGGTLTACGNPGAKAQNVPAPINTPDVVTFATELLPTPTAMDATSTPLPTPKPVAATATPTPTPTPAASASSIARAKNENPLTGLVVDPIVFTRQPLHVRIGNDAAARPQINLSKADVVYEEIVEWWATRFTAVYYTNAPQMVAPIRSARLINTQLTQQYQAALVNSGASDPVRWQLSQLPIVNLDEYFHPDPYFYRKGESWQRRLAVNLADVYTYLQEQNLQKPVTLRGFAFNDDFVPHATPASTIYINYPAQENKVLWQYNTDTGLYERIVGGEPAIDGATDETIAAPNVVVYFAKHYETDIVEDSNGATSVGIEMNGQGPAWVFRDGKVAKGFWHTDGSATPAFIDGEGELIPLRRGQTWIEVVPTDYNILVDQLPESEQ